MSHGKARVAWCSAPLAAVAFAAALITASPARASTSWIVDPAHSRLIFTATQSGGEFDGEFKRFHADIVFDPSALAGSSFKVLIETGSADTQDETRDKALASADFFAAEKWPTAIYEATQFAAAGAGQYVAHGKLTIRGVTRDIPVTFRFQPATSAGTATLTGTANLRRLDFGVGQGQWQDTKWVGNEVRIRFELLLRRK